ncbi:hypothetical protein AAVH_17591 [Aphelenchoides avenae]|nr:hypothetical protein AAVH_17591 [Aphelenchus avenae]
MSLKAEYDDDNLCDTPPDDVCDSPTAADDVIRTSGQDIHPSQCVVAADVEVHQQSSRDSLGIIASVATSLSLKRSLTTVAHGQKDAEPVTGKDDVRTESVQNTPPFECVKPADNDAIEPPTRTNVAVIASVATSRSSVTVADGPLTASEAKLKDFKLRISDIIKKRFEPHRNQLKPDVEDYKQFIRKV